MMNNQLHRSKIPHAQNPRPFNFPIFERFKLKNGLDVVFAPHTKLPLITFQLVIHSGAASDTKEKEGLASMLSDLLPEGTKSRSSYEISHGFEQLGTQFSTHCDWNGSYLEMICLKKQMQSSLDIFSDVLLNPAFDADEIERLRKRLINQRIKIADSASRIAREKFAETLYSDSRYGKPISGKVQQILSFSKNDFEEFYKENYRPNNATLIIVGDLSVSEAKKTAQKYFMDWQAADIAPEKSTEFEQPAKTIVHLVHKKNAQQAEICLGHLGISRYNPDYFSVVLLNQILGGYFLSRLNLNLREEKGFTYGVSSRFVSRKNYKGPFIITSAIDSANVHIALPEIINEIKKLREELISEQELEQAKGYLSGIFPIAFESGAQIAAGLSNIVIFNLEKDYYRTYRDKLASVTTQDILRAAKKYLYPQNLSLVVCTDKTIVEKELVKDFEVQISEYFAEK